MVFPGYFIRGLSSKDCIVDGRLVSAAFNGFKPSDRYENYEELSVNWLDDNGAIDEIQNRKKNGEVQFKCGLAILDRYIMDTGLKNYKIGEHQFKYERHKKPDNDYHGNLLSSNMLKPQIRKVIIGVLCTCMEKHLPPSN